MKNSMSRRQFILAAGALAGSAVLAGCGGSSTSSSSTSTSTDSSSSDDSYTLVKDGTLTVAAELGFAPFEYMNDQTGDPEGFDVDVINAIADKLGLQCEYLPNQKFDTLVPLIKQGGKADVSIAAITITDEREESVDFSEPYLDSNQAIVALKGSTETEETLNDASKKVVCQSGTTGNDWITENLPNATCVPTDDVTPALTGVSTGSYNAMVEGQPQPHEGRQQGARGHEERRHDGLHRDQVVRLDHLAGTIRHGNDGGATRPRFPVRSNYLVTHA